MSIRDGLEPGARASGMVCGSHFRNGTVAQVWACTACQAVRRAETERIQREHTIDPSQPYGTKILLTCRNHPEMRWGTKNIDYIGARTIFYQGLNDDECPCPLSDLTAVTS